VIKGAFSPISEGYRTKHILIHISDYTGVFIPLQKGLLRKYKNTQSSTKIIYQAIRMKVRLKTA